MLDARRDCVAPGPFHIIERVGHLIDPRIDLRQPSNWDKLVHHVRDGLVTWSSSKVELTERDIEELARDREIGRLFARIYELEAGREQAAYVFVKEHGLHEHLGFLNAWFPSARYIYLVRDPRDVVHSYLKKTAVTFEQALQRWKHHQESILSSCQWLPRTKLFRLRYEDLVTEPETRLRELCAFLEVDWDPVMMAHHETPRAIADGKKKNEIRQKQLEAMKASASGPGKQSVGEIDEHLDQPIRSDTLGQYRSGLSFRQICQIEAAVGDLMDVLGYERELKTARLTTARSE